MKQCSQCGAELPDDARFCLQCGEPQEESLNDRSRGEGIDVAAQLSSVAVGRDVRGNVTIVSNKSRFSNEYLRMAYLNHLISKVSQVPLSGIDPKAASDTQGKARLELHAVYTGMRTLTQEECEQIEECEHYTPRRGDNLRLSVLTQLDRYARLVLLGDPGSGKSTFVNFVALCLAGEILGLDSANLDRLIKPLPQDDDREEKTEPQPWSHGALLPIHVVLRDFAARGLPPTGERATARHLWDFVVGELHDIALGAYEKPLAQELLRDGALLLLDGLDEVPEAQRRREQIKQAVEDFAGTFKKCRILVTSRTYAYQQQAWRLPNFDEAVLAPFGLGQIKCFVDRWYTHIAQLRGMHSSDAQGRAELLKRAISINERLRALAERPLLLTLMASLHAWRGGSLPEKREELYADTVDLLLDWWESPKVARDANGNVVVQQPSLVEWLKVEEREKVRNLLNELAYEAHAVQPDLVGTADVPEGDLLGGLMRLTQNLEVRNNPALLVNYLSQRAGLLLPRGVGVYTFPHRTFQEYLAACHLTDYEYPDRIAELARREPSRWREVALLAGAKAARGTASAVWSLVDALCYQALSEDRHQSELNAWGALLAGQALVESADLDKVSARNQSKVERVVGHLVQVIEEGKMPAVERAAAGCALAKLGDSRPGVGLRDDGLPDILWIEIPTGPFKMGTHLKDIPSLENKFSEPEWYSYERETPQREVTLSAYHISRYLITNAQFAAFVESGGYRDKCYWTRAAQNEMWSGGEIKEWEEDKPREGPYDFGEPFNLPNHPVVGVTWYEAVAFCLWLTKQLRERGELEPGEEVSLPTESQWEKAGRGANERIYPWGGDPEPNRANYSDTGIGATSAIGCFSSGASPYGVEDLSGNVWEWCRTKWGRKDNNLEGSSNRVLRGGSFDLTAFYIRCAFRYSINPSYRWNNVGFRVCIVS